MISKITIDKVFETALVEEVIGDEEPKNVKGLKIKNVKNNETLNVNERKR